MKNVILPLMLIITLTISCNEKKQTPGTEEPTANTDSGSTIDSNEKAKSPAIAIVETDQYEMKIHKAIPFTPTGTTLTFKPKEGNQYVVLDISVKNKTDKPLNMGVILSSTKIKDEKGNVYGDVLGSLHAYRLSNPDTKAEKEFEIIWSETFPPKEAHATTGLGFQAPKDIKNYTISMPVSDDLMALDKRKEAKFSL